MDQSSNSNQTVLMQSVIKVDDKKSPRIIQKEQYEFFKSQLTDLNDKHRESMEHLKERSRQRSARSIERSRSKERLTTSQLTAVELKKSQPVLPDPMSVHDLVSSNNTNLTAMMKSHVLSDEQTHLRSEENRMRQIQRI